MSFLDNSGLTKLLTLLKGTSFPASDVFDWAKQRTKPKYTKDEIGLDKVNNTSDMDKPVSTATERALNEVYKNSTSYTDTQVNNLIGGSSTTLKTFEAIEKAFSENEDIVEKLDAAIGNKADKSDLDNHILDTAVHITAVERALNEDCNKKKHEHDNKEVLDSITYDILDSLKKVSSHIQDKIKHITSEERTLWNTVTSKVEKIEGKGLSANDLTDEMRTSYDNAVTNSHIHENKEVLDGITSERVLLWNNKSDFSGDYNDLSNKPNIYVPDGSTIIINEDGTISAISSSGSGGTSNYNDLLNKPRINGVELKGEITLADLGITEMTYEETMAELDTEGLILMSYEETMNVLDNQEVN